MAEKQPAEDLLSTVLRAYNLRAGIYEHPSVCGDYQFGTAGDGNAGFHLIGSGACWVHTREHAPIALSAGDLVVLPHDTWHVLRPDDRPPDDRGMRQARDPDDAATSILCGHFDFDSGRRNPILDALPDIIVIRADDAGDRLRHLSRLMLIEVETHDPGHAPVLDRLAHHGMALTAYCPLAQGRVFREPTLERIGRAHGKNGGQVALRWLLQHDDVVAIPRSTRPAHIENNFEVFDFELTEEQMREIAGLHTADGRIIDPSFAPDWDTAA